MRKDHHIGKRRKILARKGLCFNCATRAHRAADCASKSACGHCGKCHHTSICDQKTESENDKQALGSKLLTDEDGGEGMFPVVVVEVNGLTCCALIAGSSYASAQLISALNIKPSEIKTQQIDMLLTSHKTKIELYDVNIASYDGSYEMTTRLSKVDKSELLFIENPEYENLIKHYQHLRTITTRRANYPSTSYSEAANMLG